jgi:hypothetical protein
MIAPHRTEPPRASRTKRTGLPEGRPYEYAGSGHDEIQPEECCAECIRVVRRLREARDARARRK